MLIIWDSWAQAEGGNLRLYCVWSNFCRWSSEVMVMNFWTKYLLLDHFGPEPSTEALSAGTVSGGPHAPYESEDKPRLNQHTHAIQLLMGRRPLSLLIHTDIAIYQYDTRAWYTWSNVPVRTGYYYHLLHDNTNYTALYNLQCECYVMYCSIWPVVGWRAGRSSPVVWAESRSDYCPWRWSLQSLTFAQMWLSPEDTNTQIERM